MLASHASWRRLACGFQRQSAHQNKRLFLGVSLAGRLSLSPAADARTRMGIFPQLPSSLDVSGLRMDIGQLKTNLPELVSSLYDIATIPNVTADFVAKASQLAEYTKQIEPFYVQLDIFLASPTDANRDALAAVSAKLSSPPSSGRHLLQGISYGAFEPNCIGSLCSPPPETVPSPPPPIGLLRGLLPDSVNANNDRNAQLQADRKREAQFDANRRAADLDEARRKSRSDKKEKNKVTLSKAKKTAEVTLEVFRKGSNDFNQNSISIIYGKYKQAKKVANIVQFIIDCFTDITVKLDAAK